MAVPHLCCHQVLPLLDPSSQLWVQKEGRAAEATCQGPMSEAPCGPLFCQLVSVGVGATHRGSQPSGGCRVALLKWAFLEPRVLQGAYTYFPEKLVREGWPWNLNTSRLQSVTGGSTAQGAPGHSLGRKL